MGTVLQIWGVLIALLGKLLLSLAEGRGTDMESKLRFSGWLSYLISQPAWIIIYLSNRNYIATGIEIGIIPSMIIGLVTANKDSNMPGILSSIYKIFLYSVPFLGVLYSFYDFGGFHSLTQWLEAGVLVSYFVGIHFLANKNPKGWLWFMINNSCLIALMAIQGIYIIMAHQIFSFFLNILGFLRSRK